MSFWSATVVLTGRRLRCLWRDSSGTIITAVMNTRPCRNKWRSAITDRQRFNSQMHYQAVDRCFNMEFGYWEDNYRQWPIFVENNITNEEQANLFFNFDVIKCFYGPVWMNPAFEEQVISETRTSRIMRNCDGFLVEVPKDGHSTIPRFVSPAVVTCDDWYSLKAERFRRDDAARKIDVEQLKKLYPPNRDFPAGVYCGSMIGKIRDLLGMEGLAYAIFDYPDMVRDMVETACVLVEDLLEQVLGRIDFDYASGWEDICCKSGPLVPVGFFREVVLPRYKRISRMLKAAGIELWYTDCDGDVRAILPLLMEGGINCLFPYEVNSCAHPGELLSRYGKELRIMGGFDKMALLSGPKTIKHYMETLVPLVNRGGYIPFCDHRCPPDVKPQDYLYYLELKEKTFGMK
jgi:uroporphyrinogen decarboxylase